MKTTRIGKLVIDTADALASAKNIEDRWWAITRIARHLGAVAVNTGSFNSSTKEIRWVRSSKDPLWLEEYGQAEFAQVDPLVQGAMTGRAPKFIDIASDQKLIPASGKLRDWRAASLNYGYNYLTSHACYEGENGVGVSLSCYYDPSCLFGQGTVRAFSAVSAMIATSMMELDETVEDIHDGWAFGVKCQYLLPGERDVLSYLANGLPEYLIADILKITEFEVWRRIRSASLKMRAKTKEQALALAISRGLVDL